jgi:hypothetical protein
MNVSSVQKWISFTFFKLIYRCLARLLLEIISQRQCGNTRSLARSWWASNVRTTRFFLLSTWRSMYNKPSVSSFTRHSPRLIINYHLRTWIIYYIRRYLCRTFPRRLIITIAVRSTQSAYYIYFLQLNYDNLIVRFTILVEMRFILVWQFYFSHSVNLLQYNDHESIVGFGSYTIKTSPTTRNKNKKHQEHLKKKNAVWKA